MVTWFSMFFTVQEYFAVMHIGYQHRIGLIGKCRENQKVTGFSRVGLNRPSFGRWINPFVGQILDPNAMQGYPGFIFKYAAVKNSLRLCGYYAKGKTNKYQ